MRQHACLGRTDGLFSKQCFLVKTHSDRVFLFIVKGALMPHEVHTKASLDRLRQDQAVIGVEQSDIEGFGDIRI